MVGGCVLTELNHLSHRHPGGQVHAQKLLDYTLPFTRCLLLKDINKVRIVAPYSGHQCAALKAKDTGHVTVTVYRQRPCNLRVILNLQVHVVVRNKQEWKLVITD